MWNRVIVSGSTAAPGVGTHLWHARVRYNGAAWEVETGTSSAGIELGKLLWNGVTDELDIALVVSEDFVAAPCIFATPIIGDDIHNVKAISRPIVGGFASSIKFYNETTGAPIGTEDTDMDCNVVIVGNYV